MHISKLQLVNYRNFANTKIVFRKGINTIIGENGSGKTNLFRAIRLLLDEYMLRAARRLDEKDFHRGLGDWRGHWIIISLEFDEVTHDESIQSLFLHGVGVIDEDDIERATYNLIFRPNLPIRDQLLKLDVGDKVGLSAILEKVSIDDYETIFTGKSSADFSDPEVYKELVGDFENVIFGEELAPPELGGKIPGMLSISKEVSFTFIQALRDVVADFQNNRTNPLLTLLKSRSGEIDSKAFQPIAELVKDLNESIESLPDVTQIRADIRGTISEAAGETYSPTSLSIHSDLSDEADKLFQSLKLFVGESEEGYEGTIHELSLGGANLIYLTLKLLEFKYQKDKDSFANFLLIEEPEAHIHTHIQKTLFDKLKFPDTQIIYSTHSSHISEVSNVKNMNVLARNGNRYEAYQPANGLSPKEILNIQRYLDAIRSNLLFAKSVVLVEGDAEEILIPILIKKVLGVSLDELGISLINIRSTGFKNVAVLFHNDRIRKRCAIITDLDEAFFDTKPDEDDPLKLAAEKLRAIGSEKAGHDRQVILKEFSKDNPWVSVAYAPHTFEVDFVSAGNSSKIIDILNDVYSQKKLIAKASVELGSGNIWEYGDRVLKMANSIGKGWFAIQVGKVIDQYTVIPEYILNAITFAHGSVGKGILIQIFKYRLEVMEKEAPEILPAIETFIEDLGSYKLGTLELADIKAKFLEAFPDDEINAFLDKV